MCPVRNMYTTTGDASVPTKRARFSNGLAKYPPVKANPPTLHENTTLETLATPETPETLATVSYLD